MVENLESRKLLHAQLSPSLPLGNKHLLLLLLPQPTLHVRLPDKVLRLLAPFGLDEWRADSGYQAVPP